MIVELTLTIVTIQCHRNAFIQLIHILTLYTQNVQNSRDAVACFEILHKAFFILLNAHGVKYLKRRNIFSVCCFVVGLLT